MFLAELRYAARALGRAPGFTLVAVLTLALGIGANTAVFSVFHTVLMRPLPLADPARLVQIWSQQLHSHGQYIGVSWPKYKMAAEQSRNLEGIAAYSNREFALSDGAKPEQLDGCRVTANLFSVLGVQPLAGRMFAAEEDREGGAQVAIISYGLWQRRFGGDRDAVGRSINLNGQSTSIVGVLPRGFAFHFSDREPEVYVPRVFEPSGITAQQIQTGAGFLFLIARLAPGAALAQAQNELDAITSRYRATFGSNIDAPNNELRADPFIDDLVGDVRPTLMIALAAVVLVLLIACANVTHVVLARALARDRETTIRIALGASRWRLLQQFVAESALISIAGCGVGVLLARWGILLVSLWGPGNIPRLKETALDASTTGFAIAISCLTAIAVGLTPLLHASRFDLNSALHQSGRSSSPSRRSSLVRSFMIAAQMALAVALLIAAEVVVLNLIMLRAVNPGFESGNVLTARIALPRERYASPPQQEAFFSRALERVRVLPGVESAGAVSYLPMAGSNFGFYIFVEGQPHLGPGKDPGVEVRHASADYFRALRMPIVAGRAFTLQDVAGSTPVTIVNQTAARRFWPGQDPIGEELFLPYTQLPWPTMTLVVRTKIDPMQLAGAVSHEIAQIDPDQPLAAVRSMDQIVDSATSRQRFITVLLGLLALLAVVLTAIGLYGVIAFFVTQRTREIGIRLALGAQRRSVISLVMNQAAKLCLIGTGVGLVGAVAAHKLLAYLVTDLNAMAPAYVVAPVLLLSVALLACLVPVRRALRVDPMEALRAE